MAGAIAAVLEELKSTADELSCPICLTTATDPVALAACGHIGCAGCLAEWMSRKPECPTCRAPAPPDRPPTKVHALDNIMGKLAAVQERLEAARLEVLLRTSSTDGSGGGAPADSVSIERVFKDSVREALVVSAAYVTELQTARDKAVTDAGKRYDAMAAAIAVSAAGGDPHHKEKLARAAAERDAAVAAADAAYRTAYGELVTEARGYLAVAAKPVTLLATTVTVRVPALDLSFELRLRPVDSIASAVIPAIRAAVAAAQQADVVTYGADVKWRLEGTALAVLAAAAPAPPAEDGAAVEGAAAAAGGAGAGAGAGVAAAAALPAAVAAAAAAVAEPAPEAAKVPDCLDSTVPIFRQCAGGRPTAGTVIVCDGAVSASALRASRCLTEFWEPGTRADYFWCSTCNIKWVCAACATACHRDKGHKVSPFLKEHVAAYACCYCKTRSGGKCCLGKPQPTGVAAAAPAVGGAGHAPVAAVPPASGV